MLYKCTLLFATLALLATTSACNSDFDAEVAFAANYQTTYQKLHSCKASQHPAAKYVETWLSPDAKEAWAAYAALPEGSTATVALPVGAVLVKTQFDDAACKELKNFTVMEKLAVGAAPTTGDFRWQHVDIDGACLNCDNGSACSSCHTQPACRDFVCTKPN
jgi:hypothetical protein